MNYRNAAIKAREVVRQSHTPPFQVPQTRSRVLALYREIMRYTSKLTKETPGYRQMQDVPGRDRLRFAIWNAFHKNRYVSDRRSIDLMEFEGRFFILDTLKGITCYLDKTSGNQVQAQHYTRDLFRRLYTNDHIVEFLSAQGLVPSSPLYQSVINDPVLETAPSLHYVRKWRQFLENKGMPVVRDYEHHKELVKLEQGTSLTSHGLQYIAWMDRTRIPKSLTKRRIIQLKDAKVHPPLFGRVYKTKTSNVWTKAWRKSFLTLPPVMDMATFKHLERLADNIENDKFNAMRVQQVLDSFVGVEEGPDGKLVCKLHKPRVNKSLKPGDFLVSRIDRKDDPEFNYSEKSQ
ncbi:hypothetical protein CJU89_4684 [Yarrowia sp. B02]|nr:hypothetical protein CJU89_4684 [Yarrowia sp. B02]